MKFIYLILLLFLGSCIDNPISNNDDQNLEWEKISAFDGKSIYYIKEAGGVLLVSATDETLDSGEFGKGGLYISNDGLEWDLVKQTSDYAGPITYYKNKFYWYSDSVHVTEDFKTWESIVSFNNGVPRGFSKTSLNDIVVFNDTLYGSEVSAGTFKILDGKEPEKVNFDGTRFAGARKYFTIRTDEIVAIQNGGFTVYGDRPYKFKIPNGEFIDGEFNPVESNSIASSTAFQHFDSNYYIASNFPEMVRVYKDNQWLGITDTIPTTKHLDKYSTYVRNWALYIEFLKDDLYIGTRLGGVMKWDDINENWILIRNGLPIRENVRDAIDDLYYPVHHFESFNGKLFAGFGFLDASSDPALLPIEKQGLYIYKPNLLINK